MARSLARDHDEKRRLLLGGAARVFARDGYDRASMAGVAAECGVSKALLYHYHASKDSLLFDIVHDHLSDLIEAAEAADDETLPPRQRLEALVTALLEAYRDADDEHRVQIEALRLLPPGEQETLKALERRLVEIFAAAVRALNPEAFGNVSLVKPVTMSLFGMLNWFYMWYRDGGALGRADYAALATHLMVAGVETLPSRR